MADLPLSGVRVLDLSRLLPGPLATLRLQEMGAQVTKVEDPGAGDTARAMLQTEAQRAAGEPGTFYTLLNRGKTIERLDLKSPAGHARLLALAAQCAVLVEGFRPGVMARLGLGYDTLRALNPRLVYCAISGYGQHGPMAQRAGHDINYIGYAGVLDQLAAPDDAPIVPNFQIGDLFGGAQTAVQEILAALYAAGRTGQGRALDISMTHAVQRSNLLPAVAVRDHGATRRSGQDLLNGGVPCYNVYRTRDDRWMAVGALELKFWQTLCEVIGKPQWRTLHWSLGQVPGSEAARALKAELDAIFATRTQAAWCALFEPADCCVSPVLRLEEALAHPLFGTRQAQ